jgi:hypothetical protein
MTAVILDTDVASLTIKNRLPTPLAAQLVGTQAGITFVTLGELTKWAVVRDWGPPVGAPSSNGSPRGPSCPAPMMLRARGVRSQVTQPSADDRVLSMTRGLLLVA